LLDSKIINKIHCADCIEFMQDKIVDNSVDLVVTSPPYNIGQDYGIYKDNMTWGKYLKWCRKWLSEIYRVLKPDGRIALNCLLEMGTQNNKVRVSPFASFQRLFKKVGLHYNGVAVWTDRHRGRHSAFGSYLSASAPYIYCPFEVVMFGYKKQWKKIQRGVSTIEKDDFMKGVCGIWNLPTQPELTKANFHTDLSDLCINLLSYKGDLVLDPFAGASTVAVSCINLGRNFVMIELSQEYCEIGLERIGV